MTRQLKIVYLKPLSGYKTSLRSDTLWGLLCWGIRHLYGEQRLETFLDSYTEGGSPEWIISSTFPYKHDGKKRIPFFPKPFLPDAKEESSISEKDKLRLRKKVKKMSWLEHSDFEKTLKGDLSQKDFLEQAQEEIPSDASKIPPKEHRTISMHNKIDRLRLSTFEAPDGGQLFQTENVFWEDLTNESDEKETTGLFFLADVRDDEALNLLISVLRLYRHFGMGGNRSVGSGFFEPAISNFTLTESSEANALVNLSLFQPMDKDLDNLDTHFTEGGVYRYELEQRIGKTGFYPNTQPKKATTFFKEGSILPIDAFTMNGRFSGKLIKNFDKNFTNGYGFMVKIKI
jgi:CRISPR-associated protein Csm4